MPRQGNRLQLELHVPEFAPVRAYYGRLGFREVWAIERGGAEDYLVMEREETVLCFWPGNDSIWEQPYFRRFHPDTKRGFGVEIAYPVEDIEDYYRNACTFAAIVEPLVVQPWGRRDFRIEDPFGYYLRVMEPFDITTPPAP
jgi:hypothetical protein